MLAPRRRLICGNLDCMGAWASGRRVVALWKHRCALKAKGRVTCKSLRDEPSSARPAELCSPASGCCSRRRSRALRRGSQAEIRYRHGAIVKTLSFFLQVSGTAEGGAGGFRRRCGLQATILLCRGRLLKLHLLITRNILLQVGVAAAGGTGGRSGRWANAAWSRCAISSRSFSRIWRHDLSCSAPSRCRSGRRNRRRLPGKRVKTTSTKSIALRYGRTIKTLSRKFVGNVNLSK